MKQTKMMNNHWLLVGAFVLYMYSLLKIILFKFHSINMNFMVNQLRSNIEDPHSIIDRLQVGNLVPFKQISENMEGQSLNDFIQLFGNIGIFVPLGIFLTMLLKNKRGAFIIVLVGSLVVSLSLESAQLLFAIGNFDVDDLILNTSGGIVGYCLIRLRVTGEKCTS
ncbi:VanZ family protein [Paenibacillus agilis]|uniref:VanZ family protein n=1 Tax=Paenibacillus agilis TaxID=3020863 RepID=A0A559IKQ5_9BACL|nr:VanZ family protein [Paenibacillus agilis]TVX88245.1 VanZ family protein [Paenibacillus agilis]